MTVQNIIIKDGTFLFSDYWWEELNRHLKNGECYAPSQAVVKMFNFKEELK